MLLRFTKMHGLGNDFVVLDLITQRFNIQAEHVRQLADRRFGIGCDQLLVVETPLQPDVDFRYRIFNCDGGEVEQCGNGARCFAKFVRDKKLTGKERIRVETNSGIIELAVTGNDQVRVNMGKPVLEPAQVPFQSDSKEILYPLEVDGQTIDIAAVSMGNPHLVWQVDAIDSAPVAQLGPSLESHPHFPQRVNVGFMEVVSDSLLKLRVYERGVGETLACGTGACAAVVAARRQQLIRQRVQVQLPGGELTIEWRGEDHPVMMTGPATTVFEGQIRI